MFIFHRSSKHHNNNHNNDNNLRGIMCQVYVTRTHDYGESNRTGSVRGENKNILRQYTGIPPTCSVIPSK